MIITCLANANRQRTFDAGIVARRRLAAGGWAGWLCIGSACICRSRSRSWTDRSLEMKNEIVRVLQFGIPLTACQAIYVPIDVISKPTAPIATSAACNFCPRSIIVVTKGAK